MTKTEEKLEKWLVKYVRKGRKKDLSWGDIFFELTRMIEDVMYDVEQEEIYD